MNIKNLFFSSDRSLQIFDLDCKLTTLYIYVLRSSPVGWVKGQVFGIPSVAHSTAERLLRLPLFLKNICLDLPLSHLLKRGHHVSSSLFLSLCFISLSLSLSVSYPLSFSSLFFSLCLLPSLFFSLCLLTSLPLSVSFLSPLELSRSVNVRCKMFQNVK